MNALPRQPAESDAVSTSVSRLRLAYYGFAVFASSALLLLLEIVAGRLIAPYVGTSLYTWTSIIGVVLSGLSLGNWCGGVIADRGGGAPAAGWALAAAGFASLAILWLLTLVAQPLQESDFGLLGSSLLLVAVLFFLPALFLGVVTPLLTTLALAAESHPGRVVGRMHALAALGSIVGAFATGFWLVQWFGTRAIIIASGVLLLLLALPLLGTRRRSRIIAVLSFFAVGGYLVWSSNGLAMPCDRETRYYCIRVVDDSDAAGWGEARTLVLDALAHGISHREDPRLLIAPYVHLIDELLARRPAGPGDAAFFFAGGGSYTLPRATRARLPEARIVVAELDPDVTATAHEQLYFASESVEIVHADARQVLAAQAPGSLDAVVSDVFHDLAVPYHLLTREYFALARSRLKPGGILLMNIVDRWPDGQLVTSLLRTLDDVFAGSEAWLEAWPEPDQRHTFVLAAGDLPLVSGTWEAAHGLPRLWQSVGRDLRTASAGMDLPILSDDYTPVERLISSLLTGRLGR